jgi:hypothetical protein
MERKLLQFTDAKLTAVYSENDKDVSDSLDESPDKSTRIQRI